jgi:hypothetical protein
VLRVAAIGAPKRGNNLLIVGNVYLFSRILFPSVMTTELIFTNLQSSIYQYKNVQLDVILI